MHNFCLNFTTVADCYTEYTGTMNWNLKMILTTGFSDKGHFKKLNKEHLKSMHFLFTLEKWINKCIGISCGIF